MESSTQKTANQTTLHLKRTFDMPLYKVWQALTHPDAFKKWWGPKGFTCPSSSIDLKPGGKYLHCMKSPDGQEFWSTGTYKEIVPREKIVCTDSFSDEKGNVIPASALNMPGDWPLELLVTIKLQEVGGKTELEMQQEGFPQEAYDDCVSGWQESLDKLENANF